ncbi:MAG: VCBS repeat-containing protein, partial [Melioribacteraceae bacterium]|nr:VCBS repeat-containing protein [Melioribacteraceae bacterium]
MKKIFTLFVLLVLTASVSLAQNVNVVYAYNPDPNDEILDGLRSIRGSSYHPDPFGDGTSAVLLSNYFDNGHVHLFVARGNDSLELVWTSPTQSDGGTYPTRTVLFGDLDGDGLIEIFQHHDVSGVLIYEWDGVAGSYNFGDAVTQTISSFQALGGNFEYAEVFDIDEDGKNEFICSYNAG